jgi:tRNA-specific 2-thiouridylase
MARILVALSGGVDSAVAALTLQSLGWEPIGIHLRLFDSDPESIAEGVCCGDQAAFDARLVANWLGIPFYVRDLREEFSREVAGMTVESYARAETPNPCIACNHRVRIPALLRLADSLGIPAVATGHYVRKVRVGDRWYLAEARDGRRDQSYALYRLTSEDLERLEFPLGELDKETVRQRARAAGLPVADKAASVDLCFAKTAGGVGNLVAAARPETGKPGPLLDEHGRVVGRHPGIAYVTIGQRSGLQWDKTVPERRYVASIDPATRTVAVAPRARLLTRSVTLRDPIWHGEPPKRAQARIRYQGPLPATASGSNSSSPGHRWRPGRRSCSTTGRVCSAAAPPQAWSVVPDASCVTRPPHPRLLSDGAHQGRGEGYAVRNAQYG